MPISDNRSITWNHKVGEIISYFMTYPKQNPDQQLGMTGGRHGGGVTVLVKKCTSKYLKVFCKCDDAIFFEINSTNFNLDRNILIGFIYITCEYSTIYNDPEYDPLRQLEDTLIKAKHDLYDPYRYVLLIILIKLIVLPQI